MAPPGVPTSDEVRALLGRGDLGQNRRNLAELWPALGLQE
jgi:hypothetical protein